MKILHSSDWHLGQRLHGKERIEEHNFFLNWLIETINKQEIDILIIAGDIFDIGYPPNSALQQYYKFLMSLYKSHCKHIIIIGGNHDYISTLNAPKEILNLLNIHVIGGATEKIEDEIIEIKENEEIKCVVCAVPFLRDKDIRKSQAGENYTDKIKAIKEGIKNHYKLVGEKTQKYKQKNIPVIGTGHLYVNGSKLSDSERDIHIGNLGSVSSEIFGDYFDYVALGHIHQAQKISQNNFIRYSGSPIPLSFSERKDSKIAIIVNLSNSISVEDIEIPKFRKLVRFKGSYESVKKSLQDHICKKEHTKDWIEIQIQEDEYSSEIMNLYPNLPEINPNIEIINSSIKFKNRISGTSDLFEETTSLLELSTKDVFKKMLESEDIENPEDILTCYEELIEIFHNSENQ
ncbi:MAG: exonuclease SbcCD subunit D C-terminal domain-containing protein [Marinifilaceae bacterium]|jgi:exonuclease SbcD|nr:exonuclease SbcCD subunit D C-terminal domain-containing protein [Marinifilaceae bacterium]